MNTMQDLNHYCVMMTLELLLERMLHKLQANQDGQFADKKGWCFTSWDQVCTPRDQGGWGIPNVVDKVQKLLCKWPAKLNNNQPWTLILIEKIKGARMQGSTWNNTHWTSKLLSNSKLKIKNSQFLQKLINSWKPKMQSAEWKRDKRFDSSLQQSLWHYKAAMKSNNPAVILDPSTARTLERKGYALFQDIWNARHQCWDVDERSWNALRPKERILLNQVMEDVQDSWPTSPLISIEPSLDHWDFKGGTEWDSTPKPWIEKLANAWQKV